MQQFSFEPVFDSWGAVVVLAAVMLLVVFLFTGGGISLRRRLLLLGIRMAGLALLVLALLRPTLVRTDDQPVPAAVAILLDDSRSMTLSDGDQSTRWEAQRALWDQVAPALEGLEDSLEVRVLRYAGEATPLDGEALPNWLETPPDGSRTDIAGALESVLRGTGGRTLAAVVLVGDGTQTVSPRGVPAAASARTMASLGVPLWTVPLGPAGGGEGRDVEVTDVPDELRGFAKNRLIVPATIRSRGLSGIPIRIQLVLHESDDETRVLAERTVSPQSAFDASPVELEFTAPPPGSYRLSVEAAPQQGERYVANNSQMAFLDVRAGGGRVLYVEGQLRNEQLFLNRAIAESQDLQLQFRWLEPNAAGDYQPAPLDDLLKADSVDVIVLGDVPATAFSEAQLQQIRRLVDRGKGLLMMGGYRALAAGGWGQTPLAQVLPVQLPQLPPIPPGENADRFQFAGDVRLEPTQGHPITTLDDQGGSDAVWRRLPTLPGMTLVPPPKETLGVQVLLQAAGQPPKRALVVGEFGQGRVAVFGVDSTWRWWRMRRDDIHRRFWRQLMLWLLGRDDRPPGEIFIELDRRRWAADQATSFRAGATAGAGVDADTELVAEVITEAEETIGVSVVRSTGTETPEVVGSLRELPPGLHRLRVRDAAGQLEPVELMFQVTSADRELARPEADASQMRQLAALTESVGGRAFSASQGGELAERIRDLNSRAVVPVVAKYRLGDDPLSGWLLLALLVGTLSTEWVLRRKFALP